MQVKQFNTMDAEEIRSLDELEWKLGEVKVPWREIAPQSIIEWLDTFAKSNGSSKDLLLTSLMGTTSSLMGDSKLKILETWKEHTNLFLLALAPPGNNNFDPLKPWKVLVAFFLVGVCVIMYFVCVERSHVFVE